MCLHKIFRANLVKIITREVTPQGVEFYIYSHKPKESSQAWKRGWWRNGNRSRIREISQIKCAIELAAKHQVKRVRIEYGRIKG